MAITLVQELQKAYKQAALINKRLPEIAEAATKIAVEKAQELTPPTMDDLSGTNTRSGELKAHWATDSITVPTKTNEGYETMLANNKQYASYVNDGHRMDRHFVPGLYINDAGILEYDPNNGKGIMVGTKTDYVPGLHMTDAAGDAYNEATEIEINKLMRETM